MLSPSAHYSFTFLSPRANWRFKFLSPNANWPFKFHSPSAHCPFKFFSPSAYMPVTLLSPRADCPFKFFSPRAGHPGNVQIPRFRESNAYVNRMNHGNPHVRRGARRVPEFGAAGGGPPPSRRPRRSLPTHHLRSHPRAITRGAECLARCPGAVCEMWCAAGAGTVFDCLLRGAVKCAAVFGVV